MTLADLISAFRVQADDQITPYLWSDTEVAGYLADAENEACIRAGLLTDDQIIRLGPGKNAVLLISEVLDILSVHRAADDVFLAREALADIERPRSSGTPRSYALLGQTLYVYPTPTAAQIFRIRVSRLPLEPLSLARPSAEPEIPKNEHLRILEWAMFRAFSRRDSDTYDPARASVHETHFESHFGPRSSAHARRQFREAKRHQVRFMSF